MLLLVTAAEAEASALLRGLGPPAAGAATLIGPYPATRGADVIVVAGGIGPAASAAATATTISQGHVGGYEITAVLSVGIAGGFEVANGTLVVASHIVPADLGAHSPDGWLGAAELGWPEQEPIEVAGAAALTDRLAGAGCPVRCGPVITLSAMTGTAARADELAARHRALAEAMEGAGVALAAGRFSLPVGEVRAISNQVGHRNRDEWNIPAALDALSRAAPVLLEAWA